MEQVLKILQNNIIYQRVLTAAAVVLLIMLLSSLFKKIINRKIKDSNYRYRSRKLVSLAGTILSAIFVLATLSDKVAELTVALGITGAVIAFALQEPIASFAAWLSLLFGKLYNVGDRIMISGIYGDVIDISMTRTTIMECGDWIKGDQYNGRIISISNSTIFKGPVFNYSGDFKFLWDEIVVSVSHDSDINFVKEKLLSIAKSVVENQISSAQTEWSLMLNKYKVEPAIIEPTVNLFAYESAFNITLRYVVDYRKRRSTKDQIFSSIVECFKASPEKVQFMTNTLKLVDMPKIHVGLEAQKQK